MSSLHSASIPFELLLRIAFFTAGDKGAAHSMPLVSRGFYAATIENLYSTVNGNALTTLAQDQPTFTTYKLPAACVRELLIEGQFDTHVVSKNFAMALKNVVRLATVQRPLLCFKFSSPCLGVPLAFETDTDNTFPGFISVFLSAPCSTGEELHWYNIIVRQIHFVLNTINNFLTEQLMYCKHNPV